MTKADIGQLLSDQVTEFSSLSCHKQPLIEAEPFDDESGDGYKPLDRWMDRLYRQSNNRWS